MKLRSLIVAAATIAAFALVSCSGQSRLEKLVETINNGCPMQTGDIGVMVGAEMQDGNAVVTMLMNESYINVEALRSNREALHQSLVNTLMNPVDDTERDFVEELRLSNAGVTYIYKGETSGDTVSVSLSNEEIRQLYKNKDEMDSDAMLESQIAITKAQLPLQMDEATLFVDIVREGDCVVYYYDIDESLVSLEELEMFSEDIRVMIVSQLQQKKTDPGSRNFIHACKMADVDLVYKYKGTTTGRTLMFTVNIDDV